MCSVDATRTTAIIFNHECVWLKILSVLPQSSKLKKQLQVIQARVWPLTTTFVWFLFNLEATVSRAERGTPDIAVYVSNNYPTLSLPLAGVTVLLVQHLSCCGFLPPTLLSSNSLWSCWEGRHHMVCCTQHMVSVTARMQHGFQQTSVCSLFKARLSA